VASPRTATSLEENYLKMLLNISLNCSSKKQKRKPKLLASMSINCKWKKKTLLT